MTQSSNENLLLSPYRGRFAPSPSGPLHFGSLVAAVGSFLQAKSQGGTWLVRMEDLDPPREVAGAADDILRCLEAYHLFWDESVVYQSQRNEAYEAALARLTAGGHTFPCACSRKTVIEALAEAGIANPGTVQTIYPGTCRDGLPAGATFRTTRLRVAPRSVSFHDLLQGPIKTQLDKEVGDFVIKRADNLYAYHLAVVVDDAQQGITEIVRGMDLMDSTPLHLYLQSLLGLTTPRYAHLPVAINAQGEKLSKQTHAPAINTTRPGPVLARALAFLGHTPGPDTINASPDILLGWALEHWDFRKIPNKTAIHV